MTTVDAPVSHLRENPYEIAKSQLRKVADTFAIDPNLVNVLQECKKALGRFGSRLDGRRQDPGLPGLPRHAQRRPRPLEGRHPLPPRRHARRSQGARDVDDVEVRAVRNPVRRRQGRRRLQSEDDVRGRAAAHDAPLHLGDHQRDRAGEGHSRAGRRHGRARDGVDLRHVLDEQGPLGARRRHGQAADDRRLARPRRGDRARCALLRARGRAQAADVASGDDRRGAGLRQRRLVSREVPRGGRRDGDRRLGLDLRPLQPERHRRAGGDRAQARDRLARGLQGRRADLERGPAPAGVRRPRAVRARAGDHRGERRQGQGEDHRRGRQRPGDACRRRDPRGEGASSSSRTSSRTPAASSSPTSNGSRACRSTSGRRPR